LHIVQVVEGLPPEFIGDTARYFQALSRALQDRGHHWLVLAGSNQQARDSALAATDEGGISVIR